MFDDKTLYLRDDEEEFGESGFEEPLDEEEDYEEEEEQEEEAGPAASDMMPIPAEPAPPVVKALPKK
ncbi:MAG: hypothetical protein ABSD20_13270, partial [Terriglobales bacterium]